MWVTLCISLVSIDRRKSGLFQECEETQELRTRLAIRWQQTPTLKEWLIGMKNENPEEKAYTYVILELNQYIQTTNWKGEELSLSKFKNGIRSTEHLERMIAEKKGKVNKHEEKWGKIFKLLR